MFVDEFSPVFKQLTAYPVAFLGGFVSGLLRLNLADEPVKSWLDNQGGVASISTPPSSGNGSKPTSISID